MSTLLIHPTAIVDSKAELASDVIVGAYAVIGADVVIGEGCVLKNHVVVESSTRMGKNNTIFPFACVGFSSTDKKYKGEQTTLTIGDNNIIREGVTLHRGTVSGGGDTQIGDNNLLMPYVHIAHDCKVGNNCIFINNVSFCGHVIIGDYVTIGGYTGIIQHRFIGDYSFIAGMIKVGANVPAFAIVNDNNKIVGINKEGLRRLQFSVATINIIKQAYKILYRQNKTLMEAQEAITVLAEQEPILNILLQSLQPQGSKRGILR